MINTIFPKTKEQLLEKAEEADTNFEMARVFLEVLIDIRDNLDYPYVDKSDLEDEEAV